MITVNPYLVFKGNCEEAFNFYKTVFDGDFRYFGRYKEVPQTDKHLFPAEASEKVMHVSLPVSAETILMGCDSVEESLQNVVSENGFSLSITTDNRDEADRLFNELSAGGQVKMSMNNTFWGSYFGALTDKFGINWTISFDTGSK